MADDFVSTVVGALNVAESQLLSQNADRNKVAEAISELKVCFSQLPSIILGKYDHAINILSVDIFQYFSVWQYSGSLCAA